MPNSEEMLKPWEQTETDNQNIDSLLEESEKGISTEEHDSIMSQLDHLFESDATVEDAGALNYRPARNGALFPILTNIVVLLLTAAIIWFIFSLHDRQKQSILSEGQTVSSAEGTILREFREEAEGQMQEMRSDLSALQQEKEQLEENTQRIIEERTAEFRERLQARMSEERARLEASGISEQEIDRRLDQYRQELTEAHEQELAAVRSEAEQEIEAREQEIRQLTENYQEQLEEYESERQSALNRLNTMQQRQQEAELLAQQISSAYLSAVNAIENNNFDTARSSLDMIEDILTRDSVRNVAGIAQRFKGDREVLSALRQFITLKESRRTDRVPPQTAAELEELRETVSRQRDELQAKEQQITSLSESTDNLNTQLQNTRGELSRTRNRLETAQREIEDLHELEERLRSRAQYFDKLAGSLAESAATLSDQQDNQEILAALDNKLKILEALKAPSVRRQYPNMENLFTDYLDTFEQEYQHRGYLKGLQDSRTLIEEANRSADPAEEGYFTRDREDTLQAAAQLAEALELLISP